MSLKSGKYTILSKVNDLYIGRNLHEDRTLLPKRVITLPHGVRAPEWVVEKLSDDEYKLSIGGAHVTEIDEKVFAVLLHKPEPTKWTIKRRENHGPNVYSIEVPGGKGWVIPEDEPQTQVIVRHLIVGPSHPPHFPSNQLFTFERIEHE